MPDRITHDIVAEIVEIAVDAVICMDAFQRVTFFNKGPARIESTMPVVGTAALTIASQNTRCGKR